MISDASKISLYEELNRTTEKSVTLEKNSRKFNGNFKKYF